MAFRTKDYFRHASDRTFEVFRCPKCGLGVTVPRLEGAALAGAYPHVYFQFEENIRVEQHPLSRRYRLDRVKQLQARHAGVELLDVGANTGMFVKTAREEGFDAQGLEISADAVAFGRKAWGLPLTVGTMESAGCAPSAFDVVTLWHVWEHLPDPLQSAQTAFRLLRPGGLLALAVPNFASLQARVFGPRWFHLDVPRHLYHYTPQAMAGLLRSAGFADVTLRFGSAQHDWAGILGSIMNLAPPRESLVHKSVRKLIGTPLARLVAGVEAHAGQGGTFELYARKPAT
jgi:SAM-dependent methyltransferase